MVEAIGRSDWTRCGIMPLAHIDALVNPLLCFELKNGGATQIKIGAVPDRLKRFGEPALEYKGGLAPHSVPPFAARSVAPLLSV